MPLLFPPRLVDLQTSPLPFPTSVLACSLWTASYVGSLYLFRSTRVGGLDARTNEPLTRDSPSVIKARLMGVSASALLSLAGTAYLILEHSRPVGANTTEYASRLLGLALPEKALTGCFYPLALTATLFLGPLYTLFLDGALPGQANFTVEEDIKQRLGSFVGLRNYFFGPLTEEIVFRSCILATSGLAHISTSSLIWCSPLYFGIAHAHHAWDVYCKNGRNRRALIQGLMGSTFQFAYTTVFGWYASYLFLRSSSIVPPLIAHIFCNFMGFPQLPLALSNHPKRKLSIYAAYLLGIAGFAYKFADWTSVHSVFGGSLFFS